MGVGDIIGDALAYPFSSIKALVLYVVLGIIGAIIGNIVSCMPVPFFSGSYLLYKIVFNKRPFAYYKKYINRYIK